MIKDRSHSSLSIFRAYLSDVRVFSQNLLTATHDVMMMAGQNEVCREFLDFSWSKFAQMIIHTLSLVRSL